jgi:PAS domain-containing protein
MTQNTQLQGVRSLAGLGQPDWATAWRWKIAARLAGLGVAEWDLAAQRIHWSPELETIYGIPIGSFRGFRTALQGYIHPEDWEGVCQAIDQAIQQQGRYIVEFQIVRPGGEAPLVRSIGQVVRQRGRLVLIEVVQLVDRESF